MRQRKFYIIGAGMATPATLTAEAQNALQAADAVFTTNRLAAVSDRAAVCPFHRLADVALAAEVPVAAVLVSGDVGFFSAAAKLRAQLAPHGAVELICGLSSMQYFCAKLGVPYDDACIRSLHGRAGSILGAVSYHKKTFVLTGGVQTAAALCRALTEAGLGERTVHLGENLGAAQERITTDTARTLAETADSSLAVLLVENPSAVDPTAPVRDAMLRRAKVPMTKEEVRWVSVAKLAPQPADTVWDVGAGTGAVTVELARRACDGMVYAVERSPAALDLLTENRVRLGAYNVQIVAGAAPNALAALPAPDCVFVGGSSGRMTDILAAAREKNPAVRVVVNAVTLETLHEAQRALTGLGFAGVEVVQLAAARGKPVGAYTMMTANNPVFILSGGGADAT